MNLFFGLVATAVGIAVAGSARAEIWFLAPAVALVSLPVLLWAGRPLLLALVLVAAFAIEMAVGTLLLRGRRDRVPRLETPRDLVSFFGIALLSTAAYGALAFGAFTLFGEHASAMESLDTAVLKHAARHDAVRGEDVRSIFLSTFINVTKNGGSRAA